MRAVITPSNGTSFERLEILQPADVGAAASTGARARLLTAPACSCSRQSRSSTETASGPAVVWARSTLAFAVSRLRGDQRRCWSVSGGRSAPAGFWRRKLMSRSTSVSIRCAHRSHLRTPVCSQARPLLSGAAVQGWVTSTARTADRRQASAELAAQAVRMPR